MEQFSVTIKNASLIAGNTPGNLTVDFNKMTLRDLNNGTRFEVAGRMYFESHAFGNGYNSFTTNGFFDKEGYVEPQMSPSAIAMAEYYWVWIAVALPLVLLLTCYCCFCRTPSKPKSTKVPKSPQVADNTN